MENERLVITVPGSDEAAKPVSYSAFTSWLKCGKAYQLERIFGVPGLPAWYFVGGSTVHKVTEDFDYALFKAEGR